MKQKQCTKCGEWKVLDEFYKSITGEYGRRAGCKQCAREYGREYSQCPVNKEHRREYACEYRQLPENKKRARAYGSRHYQENKERLR